MPNIKSAEKRVRTAAKSRAKTRAGMSKTTTARRPVIEATPSDAAAAAKMLATYASTLDKAVKQGVIKRNTADRRKSRAAKRLAAATAAK